jgi:branched-chain amino acid transport system ATP-binding protein
MTPILDISHLGIYFGGLQALDGFNVQVRNREIVGLIGPNGAGKTTVFNLLTNVYQPSKGGIRLTGENTLGKTTHEVTRYGIARTFQNIRLFKSLSVLDNVKIGLHYFEDRFGASAFEGGQNKLYGRGHQLLRNL